MMSGVINAVSHPGDAVLRRWSQRFVQLPESIGASLVGRYAEPTRVYHDVRHLSDVLRCIDLLADEGSDLAMVELAAWFHDAVYDVRRADNEQTSADLARELLAPHLGQMQLAEVVRLVLLTRDHAVGDGDPDGAVLCDADLAVLAGSAEEYAGYVSRVRKEYAHLPDASFRAGRETVLRGLLALPRLFHTGYGTAHWESPARANLQAELTP